MELTSLFKNKISQTGFLKINSMLIKNNPTIAQKDQCKRMGRNTRSRHK